MVFSIYNVIKPFVTTFVYFQGFKTPADFYKYLEMIYSGQFNQLRMVVAQYVVIKYTFEIEFLNI